MDRTERFYKIDQLLRDHRVVPFSLFEERLGVSRATIKRDLEYLRNRLHAPIVWDRDQRGYRFDNKPLGAAQYELPGLWFSSTEIHALLTMQHLLAGLDAGGLLAPHVQPLQARLTALLEGEEGAGEEIRKRIRIVGTASRPVELAHFSVLGSALLRRKRVLIRYFTRSRGESTEREISPQRLVFYKQNWYLDAWCHWRNELRSFSVDAIHRAEIVDAPTKNVPESSLDAVLGAGYGIFSGRQTQKAKLKFSAQRARWVSAERWHPRQRGEFLKDGSYILEFPYSDPRELVMDILRHGPEVEVIAPESLRQEVFSQLNQTLKLYSSRSNPESDKKC